MPNIEHLSYSSIAAYLACPAAWRYRYVEKVVTPTTPELVFGSAFHQTVENYITRGGNLLEHWAGAWAAKSASAEIYYDVRETPEQFFNDGIRMLTAPEVVSQLRGIQPKRDEQGAMIERKIELRVAGVPIPVIGFIDLIHADGTVCDFKTAGRSWTQDKALAETQPLFYFAGLNQMGMPHNYTFRHYVFVKGKTPSVQVIETRRDARHIVWLERMIRDVWRGIDAGIFPTNPTGWKHDARYCDYWGRCMG